ncbi:MAG: hypothetical protein IT329_08585 [Caldilineaceae bacterium]|nr:hypothetical protein [Caldilineaceae bacterium]
MNNYVMCIDNEGYAASLDLRKVYRVLPDADAEAHGMIRIIDNSGEDYLFEADRFLPVSLSGIATEAFDALEVAAS